MIMGNTHSSSTIAIDQQLSLAHGNPSGHYEHSVSAQQAGGFTEEQGIVHGSGDGTHQQETGTYLVEKVVASPADLKNEGSKHVRGGLPSQLV